MAPDLSSREIEVEALMARLGYERYWSSLAKAKEKGEYAFRTDSGRQLMRGMVWKVAEKIQGWIDDAKWARDNSSGFVGLQAIEPLEAIGTGVAALIACKVFIDQITTPRGYTSLVVGLGYKLEDELVFRQIKKHARQLFDKVIQRTERSGYDHRRTVLIHGANKWEGLDLERLERNTVIRIGHVCSDAVFEGSGCFERLVKFNSRTRRRETWIIVSEEVLGWLDRSEHDHEMLHPFYMPTVDPPLDWDGLYGGGYHTDVVVRRPLVKFGRWKQIEEADQADYDVAAAAVNVLQHVEWEVNSVVHEAAQSLWTAGVQAADLPARDPRPIPPKPIDIKINDEARKEWRRSAAVTHRENISERGRRIGVTRTLFVGRTYRGEREPFYFPWFCDSRGRSYVRPNFLNPQGTDLARGCLRFRQRVELGAQGVFWLAIHGANCFGLDKLTLEERRNWVHEHSREIAEVDRDPIDARPFWEQAEKPWSFLAFCDEWGEVLRHGEHYASALPVQIDGRNNGLQIYTLLLRDEYGAKITCVSPGPSPEDCYQIVADNATEKLQLIRSGALTEPMAKWRDLSRPAALKMERDLARDILQETGDRLPREACKRVTMARPYNLGLWAGSKYIREWLDTIQPESWPSTHRHGHMLAPIVWGSMGEVLAGAKRGTEWLGELARITAKSNQALRWHTPTGFGVIQDYRQQSDPKSLRTTLRTALGQKIRNLSLRYDTQKVSVGDQVDGFAPNYVHSLDAACMHLIVLKMKACGIPAMTTVHDGFSCHAAHAGMMGAIVRQVYAEVFAEDQLLRLHRELEERTRLELPEPPAYGNLDPACILESSYAFS